MLKFTQLLAIPLLALYCTGAAAEVYKVVDENGRVTFTDIPPGDTAAKPVEMPTINTQPAIKPEPAATTEETTEASSGYTQVAIVTPDNDATIPPGQLDLVVRVAIEPALRQGHLVQLTYNGQPYGNAVAATTFKVIPHERGTLQLQANILDATGTRVGSSNAVTVHVKRHSIQH